MINYIKCSAIIISLFVIFVMNVIQFERVSALANSDSAQSKTPWSLGQILIQEYSDFGCLYCSKASKTVAQVVSQYGGLVRSQFRHFPMDFRRHSELPHKAALAAGEQGKFREMQDLIFANQRNLNRDTLHEFAKQLKLDEGRFALAMGSERLDRVLQNDRREGEALGVRGTPTFFINGRKIVGAQPIEVFRKIIDQELRRLKIAKAGVVLDRSNGISVFGPSDAALTLGVFADVRDNLSRRALANVLALRAAYPKRIRVVVKHYPQKSHGKSTRIQQAVLAASSKGKFWAFHALLAKTRGKADRNAIRKFALANDLDVPAFEAATDSSLFRDIVQSDSRDARARDVRGVPTFFIGEKRIDGLVSIEALKKVVRGELKKTAMAN